MGANTNIPWATDTWNPWIGCTQFSAECANCYADELDRMRFSKTLDGATKQHPIRHWGKGAPRHRGGEETFNAPIRWRQKPWVCDTCGKPVSDKARVTAMGACLDPECPGSYQRRRVFCGSLMDWADKEVDDCFRDDMFNVAEACPELIFMFLTKRGDYAAAYIKDLYGSEPPKHFWFGLSYMGAAPRLDRLANMPGSVRFLSVEPMLGAAELFYLGTGIDWVIVGGESGRNARPCHVEWVRNVVWQCQEAKVPVLVKQVGSNCLTYEATPDGWPAGTELSALAGTDERRVRLNDPKGADPSEWPADIRLHQFPAAYSSL